jgi:hypothetical protein
MGLGPRRESDQQDEGLQTKGKLNPGWLRLSMFLSRIIITHSRKRKIQEMTISCMLMSVVEIITIIHFVLSPGNTVQKVMGNFTTWLSISSVCQVTKHAGSGSYCT